MSASAMLREERVGLCDALERHGPDAPTLCEGWTTADLAAHLVVREHRPDALLGIIGGGPFARHTASLMEAAKRKGYDSMIATLRAGPPLLFRSGPGALGNVMENWIHHEDVRRANGEGARVVSDELDGFLWRTLGLTGMMAGRKVKPFGLELDADDGRRRMARRGEPLAVLRGAPSELALYLSGRKAAAQIELMGPLEAQHAVRDASFGL